MKRLTNLMVVATLAFSVAFFFAAPRTMAQQDTPGSKFVDENGDGYNDNAPDLDGDGIPNGQDPDFVKPDYANGKGKGFIDENGDGINDLAADDDGDGIPNGQDEDYIRPEDGSGFAKGTRAMGKHGFVDEDGDGLNDLMLDDDGDGIPNGQDEDWVRPEDCTGPIMGRGMKGQSGFKSVPNSGEQSESRMGSTVTGRKGGRP